MTRPPLLVHLSSNRLARLLPSLMHPTGRYTASPIFIIQRSIFSSKGLPTESCIYNLLFQFLLYCFVWRNFVENRYLPPLRIIFIYFHLNNVIITVLEIKMERKSLARGQLERVERF